MVKNIVVVGASAGGIEALSRLVAGFKSDLNAAVFVVLHLSKSSQAAVLVEHISKHTELNCCVAEDGRYIENGCLYIAPADHQLMVVKGEMKVQKGALENGYRPSIDVLFRTAAAAYSSCVSGIILSGLLEDGTSGMSAIKRSGGYCMVQDPGEAMYKQMPETIFKTIETDHLGSVDEMGFVLSDRLSVMKDCLPKEVPHDVVREAEITLRMSSEFQELEPLGKSSSFACPDCGGVLTHLDGDQVDRYRCFTGHTYTRESLNQEKLKAIEESLWVAIRLMEERKNLMIAPMLGSEETRRNERSKHLDLHINHLKEMLLNIEVKE
jgi:two-component system chemotaxis response regulator CheB